jgi:hypothetical protein
MEQRILLDIPLIEQRFRIEEDGAVFSIRKGRYAKPTFNSVGYLYVWVVMGDRPLNIAVHRLVSTKYLGQCPVGLETSHKDGNKNNNHWTNLEYISHSQNILKSYQEHGRVFPVFERKPFTNSTKEKMSNAKKKRVKFIFKDQTIIYPSIDDAASQLNTYRKKIYLAIKENIQVKGGYLSFADIPSL